MAKKYDIQNLRAGEDYFPHKLEMWQNNGWEVAGKVVITVNHSSKYFDVPMKREIKKKKFKVIKKYLNKLKQFILKITFHRQFK